MAFDVGFNFRATESYVSGDHSTACGNTTTPNTCWVSDAAYPTSVTVNGYTFNAGRELSFSSADRDAGVDIRLAGILYYANGQAANAFNVDLPATGDYIIHLAVGDMGGANHPQRVRIYDTDTPTAIEVTGTTSAGHFLDAQSTDFTAANWPAGEVGVTVNFATTLLKLYLGDTPGGENTTVAHIRIVQVLTGRFFLLTNVPRP